MAKKNVIQLEYDAPASVLGIASNDKVWKVCWQLNQALELNLASAEDDMTRVRGPVLYTDDESQPGFGYVFFEQTLKTSKLPRLARQFRYWLVIKPYRDELPDIPAMLQTLRQVDAISLAHDLSQEKDIKKLLP